MTTGVVLGRLRSGAHGSAVRFELRYGATLDDLWAALTVPERLARWLAPGDGEPQHGATVRLLFGLEVAASVIVLDCLPGRRLELAYVFPDELRTRLRVELHAEDDETVLVLDHGGFPESPAPYAAAWQVALDGLGAELAGRLPLPDGTAFEELSRHYEAAWWRLTGP
jgi:uncharacterized protein YndB with AHSA1/START domain